MTARSRLRSPSCSRSEIALVRATHGLCWPRWTPS